MAFHQTSLYLGLIYSLFSFRCALPTLFLCITAKTVLIVYAHQSPTSFNSAAHKVAVEALKEQGCKVLVSDLYAMDFEASATAKDITGIPPFNPLLHQLDVCID